MLNYIVSNFPGIIYSFFLKISDMGYKAIVGVLLVIIARLLIKNMPKWIRYFLWLIVLLQLVLPVSIPTPLSIYNLIPESIVHIDTVDEAKYTYAEENYGIDTNTEVSYVYIVDENSDASNQAITETDHNYFESVTYLPTEVVSYHNNGTVSFEFIWILGIVGFITYFVISSVKLRKILNEAVIVDKNIWACDNVDSPFVLGVFNPRIYLSSSMDPKHMDYVIMHEKMHLRSKDQILKYMAFFLLMIYWMNPAIWIAYILFCRDIEYICDENVIKNLETDDRIAYTKALLACSTQKKKVYISPVAFGEIGIKNRIKSVLEYKKTPIWLNGLIIIVIFVLGISLVTVRTEASAGVDDAALYEQGIEYLPVEGTSNIQANDFSPNENYTDVSRHDYYDDEVDILPEYVYYGDDPIEKAITEYYLSNNYHYEMKACVAIPAFCIFLEEVDENDADIIKVYGNYWLFIYEKIGTTLENISGGEAPGVMYIKKNGDEYVVDHFEQVRDGSYYTDDIKAICNGNKSLENQFFGSSDAMTTSRIYTIKKYVEMFDLDIDSYHDYGWEPVMLSDFDFNSDAFEDM